jgi:6-phosphogluconolactonase (cycloisomerase 2 family)
MSNWGAQVLKRMVLVAAAGLLALPAAASAAPPLVGGLAQLPGQLGCFSTAASASCQPATGIADAESVVVSPDGRYVYVGSFATTTGTRREASLTAFSRDPASGELTQLPGTAGCYTPDGSSQVGPNTCTKVEGLGAGDGRDFVITADGQWAYMANFSVPTAIVIFKRDPATGVLSQPAAPNGCISRNGAGQDGPGMCLTVATISDPVGLSISPDDRFVYLTDVGNHSIQVLSRDSTTGALAETQCLSDEASPPSGCAPARVIGDAQSVVISPDGLHAYATEFGTGISVFDRDPATGALTQKAGSAGCITDSGEDNAKAATCTIGRVLSGAYSISLDPIHGSTLYVTAYNDEGIAIFHVGADGTLTQLPGAGGCVTLTGQDNTKALTCTAGRALEGPYGVTIAPDDRTLYATELTHGRTEGGVAAFSIDPDTGALTQLPGAAGCLTVDGASGGVANACGFGTALGAAYQPVISPDGRSVYIASQGGQSVTLFNVESAPSCQPTATSTAYQTAVTISLSCTDADGDPVTPAIVGGPAHGTLGQPANGSVTYTPMNGYTGPDSFTFAATDGTNVSTPVTDTIAIGSPIVGGSPIAASAPTKRSVHVTRLTQSHRRWREGKHGGTTFSFTLNQAARVTLAFTQKNHQRILGRLTVSAHPGRNKLAFNGRIGRNVKLKPGTYTVTLRSGASAGQRLTFTILS